MQNKICPKCGTKNCPSASICRSCGANLPTAAENISIQGIKSSGEDSSVSQNNAKRSTVRENLAAKLLRWIAIIVFIDGFLAGIIVLARMGFDAFLIALGVWVGCFIFGVSFYGFSEIIRLLEAVKANTAKES